MIEAGEETREPKERESNADSGGGGVNSCDSGEGVSSVSNDEMRLIENTRREDSAAKTRKKRKESRKITKKNNILSVEGGAASAKRENELLSDIAALNINLEPINWIAPVFDAPLAYKMLTAFELKEILMYL